MIADMNAYELRYALAKQVPAMRRIVMLDNDYGVVVLDGAEAAQVAALAECLLTARLATLEAAERDALD